MLKQGNSTASNAVLMLFRNDALRKSRKSTYMKDAIGKSSRIHEKSEV